MADISRDRNGFKDSALHMSVEEQQQYYLNIFMADKIIDDDLPFNPFAEVESLVAVGIHVLSGQYEYFARLTNGVVISLSGYEFNQVHFLLFGSGVASKTGLSLDGYSASLWIAESHLRKAISELRFSYECPVWKVWRKMDTLKSTVIA